MCVAAHEQAPRKPVARSSSQAMWARFSPTTMLQNLQFLTASHRDQLADQMPIPDGHQRCGSELVVQILFSLCDNP